MATMLFGVSPPSVPIYLAVCLLLALVAAIAIAVPSKRATRVDPLAARRIHRRNAWHAGATIPLFRPKESPARILPDLSVLLEEERCSKG
jgi:hypothetical protein